MQSILKKIKPILLNILLIISTLIILIHKIDFLDNLRFLGSLKIFYLLFFITIFGFVFLKLFKIITSKNVLIHTLPAQIILFIGINLTENLHYIFDLIIGAWLIFGGILIVQKIIKINQQWNTIHCLEKKELKLKKIFSKKNIIFLAIVIIFQLFFTFYHSNKSLYVDEKLWTYGDEKRIQTYWMNIFTQDWYHTIPSDKPGVTLALISGIGLKWTDPYSFLNVQKDFPDKENRKEFTKMLFIMRIPTIFFISFNLIILYFLISNLFNSSKIGLISTAFISLSSLLIGISRLINPDALTWIFIPLTIFTYFLYQKNGKEVYLYSTGFLLGLSLLTKYIANLFFPFFLIEIFVQAILFQVEKESLSQFFKKKFFDYIAITILSLITFYILYPGVWVKLDRLFIGTLGSQAFEPIWKPFVAFVLIFAFDTFILNSKIFIYITEQLKKIKKIILILVPIIFVFSIIFVLINVYSKMYFVDFETLMASPKTAGSHSDYLSVFIAGFYGLIFGITPLVLLGLLINLFFNIKDFIKKEIKKFSFKNYIIWQILFFILIYFLASAFSKVVPMVRYQIVIYPLIILLSCLGFHALWLKNRLSKKIFYMFLTLTIIINVLILWTVKPFYFSYNSLLLPQNYIINPKDIGDGNYEMAEYLNDLDNPENLIIWSDKSGVCDLFVGKCFTSINDFDFENYDFDFDYFIVSRGRESKVVRLTEQRLENHSNYSLRLDRLYKTDKILHEINPGNRKFNYIRIIDGDDVKVWEE